MMLLLAALLSFGWPPVRLEFGPPKPIPAGCAPMVVNSCCGSMRPHLTGGELIYVSPPKPGERLLGMVVATPYALHWVTAETKNAVRTAGTANHSSDGWTPKSQVRYVVRYVVRKS